MLNASTNEKNNETDESKSFLQQFFGVDKWCTVYEEDEGFKLLADLSLCMYFGCGKKTQDDDDSSEEVVPKVVSVTNSEDYDCSDTISDICEDRHSGSRKVLQESSGRSRKPDPPPRRSNPNIITLVHPPPPPPPPPTQIDSPSTERHNNTDESSRVTAHYERREALDDSDAENVPPPSTVVVGRKRKSKRRTPREDIPSIVYHSRESSRTKHRSPADEYPADDYSTDEYPVIVYSDDKSSVFGYV